MCVCEYIYVYILPSPASCPSPTDPALRASPYPEIPYLLCFNMSAAAHLGDLLGVRGSAARNLPPLPGEPQFSKAQAPLFRQTHSRVPCPWQRKRTKRTAPHPPNPISSWRPISATPDWGSEPSWLPFNWPRAMEAIANPFWTTLAGLSGLTRVQLLFTRNPSALQPSKFSSE